MLLPTPPSASEIAPDEFEIDHEKVIEVLSDFGECVPQPPEKWNGNFPLPQTVLDFYSKIGPMNIKLPRTEILIPSLENLASENEQYEDWRNKWAIIDGEPSGYKPEDFLVIFDYAEVWCVEGDNYTNIGHGEYSDLSMDWIEMSLSTLAVYFALLESISPEIPEDQRKAEVENKLASLSGSRELARHWIEDVWNTVGYW